MSSVVLRRASKSFFPKGKKDISHLEKRYFPKEKNIFVGIIKRDDAQNQSCCVATGNLACSSSTVLGK